MKIHISNLKTTSNLILAFLQVPEDKAAIITDTVLYAHLQGKGTHGMRLAIQKATTPAARSRVREVALHNTRIPTDWALDASSGNRITKRLVAVD